MSDNAKLTPEELYNRVMADNGKTFIDKLAKDLGVKPNALIVETNRYAGMSKLPVPTFNWVEEVVIPAPPKVFEHGSNKQNLNVTSQRLAYFGLGEVLAFESARLPGGELIKVVTAQGETISIGDRGALVLFPTTSSVEAGPFPKTEEPEAVKQPETPSETPAPETPVTVAGDAEQPAPEGATDTDFERATAVPNVVNFPGAKAAVEETTSVTEEAVRRIEEASEVVKAEETKAGTAAEGDVNTLTAAFEAGF